MIARTTLLITLISVVMLTGVFAAEVTVIEGDILTINADTGVTGSVSSASATFSIPAVGYLRDLTVGSVRSPVFTDTVRMNVKPGVYPLTIRLGVNGETVSFERVDVRVVSRSLAASQNVPTTPSVTVDAPSRVLEAISVPAIPDLTAGELFVLPVRVRGNGEYLLEIPSLPFGTYEIPNPVVVSGERVVPVLIRVNADAQPGTYTIPIHMAGVRTDARVRILQYTERTSWTNIVLVAGIVILLIAVLLALILGKGPREPRNEPRERNSPRSNSDDAVISYY